MIWGNCNFPPTESQFGEDLQEILRPNISCLPQPYQEIHRLRSIACRVGRRCQKIAKNLSFWMYSLHLRFPGGSGPADHHMMAKAWTDRYHKLKVPRLLFGLGMSFMVMLLFWLLRPGGTKQHDISGFSSPEILFNSIYIYLYEFGTTSQP